MGLFDFVKDAGSKLGETIYEATHKDENLNGAVEIAPERVDQLRRENILKTFAGMAVDFASVEVEVKGPLVILKGSVPDQSISEKLTLAAGNQFGIAQVDCQLTVEKSEPEAQFYTVKSGDTLSKIAAQFYGNAGKYMLIFEANQPLLKDPNKIFPGQALRIPPQ